jgi:hypothetical protein
VGVQLLVVRRATREPLERQNTTTGNRPGHARSESEEVEVTDSNIDKIANWIDRLADVLDSTIAREEARQRGKFIFARDELADVRREIKELKLQRKPPR